jgi:predicted RNA-binding Zn-ribbon protein involved in translation (DUF1610 family)
LKTNSVVKNFFAGGVLPKRRNSSTIRIGSHIPISIMSSLFSIQCTTCNAKISVKSEVLIGQILPCPRCGGMVLIEPSESIAPISQPAEVEVDPTPSPNSLQVNPPQQDDLNTKIKFFPNTLTSITDSALLNVNKPVEITLNNLNPLQNTPPIIDNISESEIHKRTIMLAILGALFVILIFTAGLLFVQRNVNDKIQNGEPANPDVPEVITKIDVKPPLPPAIPMPPDIDNIPATPVTPANPTNPTTIPQTILTPPATPQINVTKNESQPETDDQLLLPAPHKKIQHTNLPDTKNQPDTDEATLASNIRPEITEPNSIEKYFQELKNETKNDNLTGINNFETMKRLDVPARLRRQIVGLRFEGVALAKALRAISELTEIPISFDVEEMRAFGVKIDESITGNFSADNVSGILDKILTPLNLISVVERDQLTITILPEKKNELITERISVSDIVKGVAGKDDLTAGDLVSIIERLVDPVGFVVVDRNNNRNENNNDNKSNNNENVNNITPQIRIDGDSIFICSYRRKVDESIRLLEQIRLLRGLPQKTKIVEENLAPEVFGWDKVDVFVTLNYYQETPLSIIFGQIEKMCGILIVIDHKELHRINLSFDQLQGKLNANNITLNEALEQLLASIDGSPLAYRIIGGNIIELTTNHIVKQPDKMSVEVHSYKIENQHAENGNGNNAENNDKQTPEQIVESIYAVIEPASWNKIIKTKQNDVAENNIGGEKRLPDKGEIVIDKASSCLIIRQTQPIHRQIRTWLKQQ